MDVTPWNHWRVPVIPNGLSLGLESGPVLVTVEYNVDPTHVNDFLKPCIVINGSVVATERRAGGFYRDAEHLRQHERFTRADRAIEERINKYALTEPQVRHMIYATPTR
jgi:hypothetical protein